MYYKTINNLSKIILALLVVFYAIEQASAQEATLELEDEIVDEIGVDSNIPDELSLFSEEETVSGMIEPSGKIEPSANVSETENTVSLNDEALDMIEEYNSSPLLPTAQTPPPVINDNFGEDLLYQIDDNLFAQMSDIEKQTALLTLELRRERIKNEIEAIRVQRAKALETESIERERRAQQKQEWENEQQRKLIAEQTKLQEANIRLEQVRQEKVVNAYKNTMLQANQKWIANLSKAYDEARVLEEEKTAYLNDFKTKMSTLATLAKKLGEEAITAKENYQREVQNLNTQITILNSRIDNLNAEIAESVDNPFATSGVGSSTVSLNAKLRDEYMIMEIKGKGEDLIATIMNKGGSETFLVQKGTVLRSGHIIEEIAPTFIRADRNGKKDFLYFAAGGVMDKEPDSDVREISPMGKTGPVQREEVKKNNPEIISVSGSLMETMFSQ